MDLFIVKGKQKLSGEVKVSSAKNSVLKILAASLLCQKKVFLKEVPQLQDVKTMLDLLRSMGVLVHGESTDNNEISLDASIIEKPVASYEQVKTMRASILVLAPLLARCKRAKVSLPGGCAIGARPIDLHLKGLKKMGAKIQLRGGYVYARCEQLQGAKIILPFPSVGATETLLMAAVCAVGETTIENAAREPEIEDLAHFLRKMSGVKIQGEGTPIIRIQGCGGVSEFNELKTLHFQAMGDRIEAATFIIAAVMTQSEITVKGFNPHHIRSVLDNLTQMGAKLEEFTDGVKVKVQQDQLQALQIDTAPYPGFPTDVQAQMMALLCLVPGSSMITEHIFENRFMHVPELQRMGAEITIRGSSAVIKGVEQMYGAQVMCTDLRASAALLLAALCAEGQSVIRRVYHIDRGYQQIDQKLSGLGAKIKRMSQQQFKESEGEIDHE